MTPSLSTLEWAAAATTPMPSESPALMTCESTELTFLHLCLVTKSSALKRTCAEYRRTSSKLKSKSKPVFTLVFATNKGADWGKFKAATDVASA